ncbi:hypothetical protein [Gilvimarinus gilvus]|uniref:hypothetical protein n=1 Tax=Gilvimarinus gilvus TaxID=3058038 RepID=UPI0034A06EA8
MAKRVKTSQSRIAKLEARDSSVSIDALTKSLLALGASSSELSKAIGSTGSEVA